MGVAARSRPLAAAVVALALGSACMSMCVGAFHENSEGGRRLQTSLPDAMAVRLEAMGDQRPSGSGRNAHRNLSRIVKRFGWSMTEAFLSAQELRALAERAALAAPARWDDEMKPDLDLYGRPTAERFAKTVLDSILFQPPSKAPDAGAQVVAAHDASRTTTEVLGAARAVVESEQPSEEELDGVVRVIERATGFKFVWPGASGRPTRS